MTSTTPILHLLLHTLLISSAATAAESGVDYHHGSIVFTTLGRSDYAFDIFTLPTTAAPSPNSNELQLTDSNSINYNGYFSSPNPQTLTLNPNPNPNPHLNLVYVTERNRSYNIYLDEVSFLESETTRFVSGRVQVPLLNPDSDTGVSMKDRPILVNGSLVYVSTHEESGESRSSWAAVYLTRLDSGLTQRLTPYGVADFSPAVSPSGEWTAVASYGGRGWSGEIRDLVTDIYVFRTRDGSDRVMLSRHGGWPSWADESTLYFHRQSEDGWWSIYRATIECGSVTTINSVRVERVTQPGQHVFTPAASAGNKRFIAVATRRPSSEFRHIELYDVISNEFTELTRLVSPRTHHFNPFLSPDSTQVGYHRCRGGSSTETPNTRRLLEKVRSPLPETSLFRVDGSFPSFSPAGDRIAFVKFPGLHVVNRDGSNWREVYSGTAFSTAWDPVRNGVVYTSVGPTFAGESTKVDIISIDVDADELSYKKLTIGGENNAFPSVSPDGKWIAFRSGRSGHKNLYIMDALKGEVGGLHRLTMGPWTDTMCNWSPDGDWIAFASDRANPGGGGFELYMIHPNGTGLKRVVKSGSGGRANHPWFSPDGKQIVFTSDYSGVSAEPIGYPHTYQPYGDIFVVKSDGTNIRRLTHNPYEDGTPTWAPKYIKPVDVVWQTDGARCEFEDLHWLGETPNRGYGITPWVKTKAQCG